MLNNKEKFLGEGLTYDDVLLVPSYSEHLPNEVNLSSKFTRNISIKHLLFLQLWIQLQNTN